MQDGQALGEDYYAEENATFGDRVAAARDRVGLSQGQLARRLGVKAQTVANWESDRAEPRANKLQMLAGVLNVSMVWLMTGEGDGLPAPEEPAATDRALHGLLTELRETRMQQARLAERLARIEKRLRAIADAQA